MTNDAGQPTIAVGMPVTARDGAALGRVKEVQAGYFKVDVRLKPDYWLQVDYARVADDGQVVMDFGKEELGTYKVKELPARVVDPSMPLTAEAVRPAAASAPTAPTRQDEEEPRARP